MDVDEPLTDLPPPPVESNGNGHVELAVRGGKVQPKRPDPKIDQELAVPQSLPFTSFEEFVKGGAVVAPNTALVSVDKLIEMRQKDGTARALSRLITLPIITAMKDAEWVAPDEMPDSRTGERPEKTKLAFETTTESSDEEKEEERKSKQSEEDLEEVEFANRMWTLPPQQGGMSVTKTKFIRNVLLGVIEGFSMFEEVRTIPTEGPLKGQIVARKLMHLDSRTIRFLTDEHGGFAGIKQVAWAHGRAKETVIDDTAKLWYWAANEEENPFYGVSFFESAWHHYDIKRKLYYIAHIASQMAAVKGRIGKVPMSATPDEIAAFKKMLADFAFNTSGTMKDTFDILWAETGTNFPFLDLINHHNQQMSKSVLAKFLEDVERQVLIENGSADPSADFFVMGIESIMDEVAENLTHFHMPKFIDWNYNSGVYPKFAFGVLSDTTKNILKELFTVIATAQATQWTPEFIREIEMTLADQLGFSIDYDAVADREEQEKAEQEAFQRDYLASKGGGFPPEEQGGGGGGTSGEGEPIGNDRAIAAASRRPEVRLDGLVNLVGNMLRTRRGD